VVFLGSTGLTALVRARAQLGREERALVVICPPGPVRRLFEVVGIVDLFELFDSREAAAASLLRPE
jgi:anti-anti-sigma factor